MAEYCPKCNYKLRLRDWRPECPACGVNVVYYGIENRLRDEADAAEYHHALNQPKFDRLKFSLIGHPLNIARLVLGLLPVAALLLPMGRVEYHLPFSSREVTVNIVSIITFFVKNGFDFDLLTKLFGSEVVGRAFLYFAVSLVSLALLVLFTLVSFFLLTLSASPRGYRRNTRLPIAGILLGTVSFVSFLMMINTLNASFPDVFSGTVNPLCFISVVLLFLAQIIVSIVYKKKDIQVTYTDVSELLIPYSERPSTKAKSAEAAVN